LDSRSSFSSAELPQEETKRSPTTQPDKETAENDVDFDEDVESESEEGNTDHEERKGKFDGSQNQLKTDFNYADFITGPTEFWITPEQPDPIENHPNQNQTDGQLDLIGCLAREKKFENTHSAFELEVKRRISKLTARYQRLRSHKPLVKHQLKNKLSILRRILGNVGQDPSDTEVKEEELDTRRPISLRFIRALNNVAGETSTVLGYLLAFGYLPKVMKLSENRLKSLDTSDELATPCQLEEAIGEFQKFNGLPVTKKLDFPTIKKLRRSRCGMRDIPGRRSKRRKWDTEKRRSPARSKRYVLRKRSWRTGSPARELTYYVKNCTNTLPFDVCKNEIREGIKRWTEAAPIFFREVGESEAASADFTIYFVSGEHPKKNLPKNDTPFDGPGGVIGHAYFPRGGHIHFDNSETYSWNSDRGINLRYFTVHEIGHALGLEHSDVSDSVMIPVYDFETRGWAGSDRLYEDDIQGIRRKYGKGRGYVKSLKAG
jgi:hypothetical protein